jgi:hypothetical protein
MTTSKTEGKVAPMNILKIAGVRCAVLVLLAMLATAARAQNNEYLIRDARIVPVTGPVIAHGSVHIKDGKIVAVGERVTAPATAKVIDARTLRLSGTDRQWHHARTDRGWIGQETHDFTELGDFSADAKAIVAVNPNSS